MLQLLDDQHADAPDSESPHVTSTETAHELDIKMQSIRQASLEYEVEGTARAHGWGYVNLQKYTIPPNFLGLIPEEDARRLKVVCFGFRTHEFIDCGTPAPDDEDVISYTTALAERYRVASRIYLVSEASLASAFAQYARVPKTIDIKTGVEITPADIARFSEHAALSEIATYLRKISLTDMVTFLMAAALKNQVTDIHVEAEEHDIKIRFRIDGVLHTVATLEKDMWRHVASRMKLLAGLKINIDDRPQDGRVRIELEGGAKADVRVSTLPTAFGESVAMRILRSESGTIELSELGLSGQAFERLVKEIERSSGMILTCGPTGAGKTTTLYAAIMKLNTPDTKIITIEDPIEYELEGVNQSQVRPDKGYTFADGLKSIVRQDPDIIMVGEMRDLETVDIAINAALTGHLVLSTIHTRSAAGTIPRLLALGAKAFLLAPALNAVVAQRLVRKICASCKSEHADIGEELRAQARDVLSSLPEHVYLPEGVDDVEHATFFHGIGCDACGGIGYLGRTGIFEVFTMSSELEQLILAQELSEYKIQELLIKQGMVTMKQDGVIKALQGITTLEEVLRVTE